MYREDLGLWLSRAEYREYLKMSEEDKKELKHQIGWYIKGEEANV